MIFGRVLLIGDVSRALLDAGSMDRHTFEVRANILDGIDAAARHPFDAVGLVMDGTSCQLGSALRALRKSTRARIILLAQMYEEPIARRLVAEVPGEEKLADEYLVCPVCVERVGRLEGRKVGEEQERALRPPDLLTLSPSSSEGLEQKLRRLEHLATTDDLTGLKNRRYLWEFARQILDRAHQTHGRVTLLVFDIDSFKHYNDAYGHAAGDEILRQVGVLMRRCCRSHDVVGRIGGDEFAAIFWDDPHGPSVDASRERRSAAEHPTEAISVTKRFQRALGNADPNVLGPKGEGVLTISGGLASFPRDGSTVEQLFERADQALLEAKRSGKNRIYLVGEPQSDIADLP
jgi:diguanylate cyclase (GGDEF)-like protein